MPVPQRRSTSFAVRLASAVVAALLAIPAHAVALGAQSMPAFASDTELRAYLLSLRTPPDPRSRRAARVPACTVGKATERRGLFRRARARAALGTVVTGRVHWSGGKPLAGAQIVVDAPPVAGAVARPAAMTDAEGRYRLLLSSVIDSARRTVRLRARAIGFEPVTHVFEIAKGDSAVLDFALCTASMQLSQVVVTSSSGAVASGLYAGGDALAAGATSASITNSQHASVDEGGIVKLHRDHLVVLRRGRLFTVRVGDDSLRPVAMVDAFPPDTAGDGGWYDELVISGDRAVVVGYSYARGATELNLFRLDAAGGIRYESTWHFRSDDYYSSRNYASRVVDGTLVFYAPLFLSDEGDPLASLPALRRWRSTADSGKFERIVVPTRVFRARRPLERGEDLALHTVTKCDLAAEPFRCEATVVVGPPGEVFYVSPRAVYVWASKWSGVARDAGDDASVVYRLPLDGGAPGAIAARGSPIDQFSFLEDDEGHLDVLVGAGAGTWMWASERRVREVALVRIPLASFGDGSAAVPLFRYRRLPSVPDGFFHNRFVGGYVLYGGGNGWLPRKEQAPARLMVVGWRGGAPAEFDLPHGVDRIEPMGADAVVIGGDGRDLHFTGVRLGEYAELAQRFRVADAAQGELRSHGFFYRPTSADAGMFGLPIAGRGRAGWQHLRHGSAAVLFVRNDGLGFGDAGQLGAAISEPPDDGCVASCVDWYGNARPIFLGDRVFALLGYELVEGRVSEGRVTEVRRASFTPTRGTAAQGSVK